MGVEMPVIPGVDDVSRQKQDKVGFDIRTFNPSQYQRIEDMPEEARGYFMPVPKSEGGGFRVNQRFDTDLESARSKKYTFQEAQRKEHSLQLFEVGLKEKKDRSVQNIFSDQKVLEEAEMISQTSSRELLELAVQSGVLKLGKSSFGFLSNDGNYYSGAGEVVYEGKTWRVAANEQGKHGTEYGIVYPIWASEPLSRMSDAEVCYCLQMWSNVFS